MLPRVSFLSVFLLASLYSSSQPPEVAASRPVEVAVAADAALLGEIGTPPDEQTLPPTTPLEIIDSGDELRSSHESVLAPALSTGETRADSDDHSSQELHALQAEIDALDDMIRLQEKKLRVLREMRNAGAIGHKATLDRSAGSLDEFNYRDAIERRLDDVEARSADNEFTRRFDTYFMEKNVVQVEGGVVAVKMRRLPSAQAVDLMVLAYRSGRLEFYMPPFIKIHELSLANEHLDVKSVKLEIIGGKLYLVVKRCLKNLSIYTLEVTETARASRAASGADNPKVQISVAIPAYGLHVQQLGDVQFEARLTAFSLIEGVGRIVASCEDGTVSVLSINGSQIDSMKTESAQIQAVASSQRALVFSDKSNVVITSIGGGAIRTIIRCHGSSDSVISLAFDAQQSDVIYASTQAGDILTFRFMWGSALADQPECQLVSRTTTRTRAKEKRLEDITLKATKGYLLAAGSSDLTVFNLSRASAAEQFSLAPITSLQLSSPSIDRPLLFDFVQGASESSLILVSPDPTGPLSTLQLFHSFLTSPAEQRDFPWAFATYMAAALVVVIAIQIFTWRSPERSQSPWNASSYNHPMSFENFTKAAGSRFGSDHRQASRLSNRVSQHKGKQNAYAVGEAFEETYNGDAFEEDKSPLVYHSLRDELAKQLASSGRSQRV